jgi:hypothetical protein
MRKKKATANAVALFFLVWSAYESVRSDSGVVAGNVESSAPPVCVLLVTASIEPIFSNIGFS